MGTRPKELFHLFGDLNNLSGIGPKTIINLKRKILCHSQQTYLRMKLL